MGKNVLEINLEKLRWPKSHKVSNVVLNRRNIKRKSESIFKMFLLISKTLLSFSDSASLNILELYSINIISNDDFHFLKSVAYVLSVVFSLHVLFMRFSILIWYRISITNR